MTWMDTMSQSRQSQFIAELRAEPSSLQYTLLRLGGRQPALVSINKKI